MATERVAVWLRASIAIGSMALLSSCTTSGGQPPTPTPSGSSPLALSCPTIDPNPPPKCPGAAMSNMVLACSAPVRAAFDSQRPMRLGVTLAQGSTVTGTVRSTPLAAVGEPCHGIGAALPITITFGLEYIGDIGPSAPICIARSKVTFTQFETGGSVFSSAWNPTVRSAIQNDVHLDIDRAVVAALGSTGPARCTNYTDLP